MARIRPHVAGEVHYIRLASSCSSVRTCFGLQGCSGIAGTLGANRCTQRSHARYCEAEALCRPVSPTAAGRPGRERQEVPRHCASCRGAHIAETSTSTTLPSASAVHGCSICGRWPPPGPECSRRRSPPGRSTSRMAGPPLRNLLSGPRSHTPATACTKWATWCALSPNTITSNRPAFTRPNARGLHATAGPDRALPALLAHARPGAPPPPPGTRSRSGMLR